MAQYCKLCESIKTSTVSICENSAVVHKNDSIFLFEFILLFKFNFIVNISFIIMFTDHNYN